VNPDTGYDLWTAPLKGDRKPRLFLGTKFDEKNGRFSPDGRWIAFTSNKSGRSEVYVRALAAIAPAQWQVSTDGGLFPTWSHDGKEFY
jgi:Tol biopolymer transport system component